MLDIELFNILIVDDNKNNLLSLHSLIDQYIDDVHVIEADSGINALNVVMKQRVDLIILDIQMPEMDGFETAQAIRSWPKMQHIPIVFLTAAYKSEEFEQKGFAIGAADYLTKPIDAPQLVARIKSYIRLIKQERQYQQDLEAKVRERTAELSTTNQQLHEAKKAAEAANHAKSRFLANMSHELRTPLNAIIGYSEILQEYAEDTEQEECITDLEKILLSSKHLLKLIDDMLDISKIETGRMDLFYEIFSLSSLIDQVVKITQPLMEKQGNAFQVHCESNAPQELYADFNKVSRVLLNLLSNAAKFTEQGQVRLEIIGTVEQEREWVQFQITDSGIGMTDEAIDRLFKPFTQADSSTTRKYDGAGLGLVIAKQFTEMMEGTLSVQSQLQIGTTFWLHLPVVGKLS